jgi:hypothetical protein
VAARDTLQYNSYVHTPFREQSESAVQFTSDGVGEAATHAISNAPPALKQSR